jgi:signal transduction histidine kinase
MRRVRSPPPEPMSDQKREGVVLLVEDEGPGFSAQARAQLFQRFSRSNSHLGLVKGYGLGLAIVRQIADLHQAVVSVQNRRPDGPAGAGGARIHVTFPAVLQPTH